MGSSITIIIVLMLLLFSTAQYLTCDLTNTIDAAHTVPVRSNNRPRFRAKARLTMRRFLIVEENDRIRKTIAFIQNIQQHQFFQITQQPSYE